MADQIGATAQTTKHSNTYLLVGTSLSKTHFYQVSHVKELQFWWRQLREN